MSIFSSCSSIGKNASETASIGHSLAHSLYRRPLTVLLTGELGAGKTTFAQGFAAGLGIEDKVTSPTYALEQRYENFIHIDLYRLSRSQAEEFLMHGDDHSGIRLIEWAERIDPISIGPHIHVRIEDRRGALSEAKRSSRTNERMIHCHFLDEPVPEERDIDTWIREVHLPPHIQAHCEAVTTVADALAVRLVERGWLLRLQALHAAARLHDLLRFLDFRTWEGDALYRPTAEDRRIWTQMKAKYDLRHETAAAQFLMDRGFAAVGQIVRTHRGDELPGNSTTEQKLLAYADKRVSHDRIVTVDERFDEFISRYGNGTHSTRPPGLAQSEKTHHAQVWREQMRKIERELFGEEPTLH